MRSRRRAPALVVALGLLVGSATACGDTGDEDTSPTTTAPPTTEDGGDASGEDDEPDRPGDGGGSTGTDPDDGGEPTTPAGEPSAGDDATTLDAAQAEALLVTLLDAYRDAVAGAAAAGRLDEAALAALGRVFSGPRASVELQGLQQAGVEVLNPAPTSPSVAEVALSDVSASCAGGTATIDGIASFVTVPVDVVQPYYFRLVPAADGAADPAWRLDFLGFSTNGVPLDGETTCA